jgi:hypothetical protein
MTGVFRDTYERPGHLLRDEMLDDAGRGAGVGARVLGGIVHARGDAKAPLPFRLAARVGVLAAVVLAAAVPKSERHKRAKLVMFLAYLVGAGVIALGASQDWAVLTKVGIWLVVLTAAANIGLWLLARKLRLGALGSSSLWVTGALALAIAAGGVLVLAEFELLRAADGPVPWLVSAVALALVIGGALIRRKPKRHPPAPGQPPPPPPPDPTSEQAKRTKSRRRWALIAMLVGVVWLLLLAGWQLDHIGQTRDWVPLFSKHSAGA